MQKSWDTIEKFEICSEEPRNRRSAKSRQYGDDEEDEIYDNASRKLNEDEDDYKEFDEEVDEHRDERNLRSRQENDIHDEKDEEERSHQRDEDRSKSRQTARSARSARKPSDPATTTKQWGVELMSPWERTNWLLYENLLLLLLFSV